MGLYFVSFMLADWAGLNFATAITKFTSLWKLKKVIYKTFEN